MKTTNQKKKKYCKMKLMIKLKGASHETLCTNDLSGRSLAKADPRFVPYTPLA